VRPDVEPSDAVAELCERLDRLPLALELAAARTKLLTPEALLDRLGNRLDALRGTRDAEERHATLRATIAWSHDLLGDHEQRLFARLGVFRGGCTLETAEIVCDADVDTLASLLDKSLVRRRAGRLGEDRYWLLETVREFALERLIARGEADALRAAHAQRMLAITRDAHLSEQDVEADIPRGLTELEDLRAALDWAEEADAELGLELGVELQDLWNAAAPAEGMARLERLLERAGSTSTELRARALRALAGACDLAGHGDRSEPLLEESLRLYEELGDDRGSALVEHMLAVGAWRREDWARMRQLTEHSLELAAGRFGFIETTGYWLLGQLALVDGDLERATELTRESATRAGEAGWTWWRSGQLHELLMLALRSGDLDSAEREGRAALELEREHENRLWALYTLAGLAQVALARGELEGAGLLWGAAEREAERLPRWPDERERRGGALLAEESRDFRTAYASGRELELWDAVALVLDEEPETVE
jgi:predicted ATPase